MSTDPVVVPVDAEKLVVDCIHDQIIPNITDLAGFTVGTVMGAGVTPKNFIHIRSIGGVSDGFVADTNRVDVRVWCDGTIGTESKRNRVARMVLAHLRQKLRAKVFASPVPLPDPADPTKTLTLFTIELFLRGRSA